MPNTREKLIELIEQSYYCDIVSLADHLIANGVTFADDRPRFFIKSNQKCIEELEQIIGSGPVVLQVGEESIIPIHPGRWIPVTERLPEEEHDGVVLVYSGGVEPAIVCGDRFLEYDKYEGWEIYNVTHWMPLPEPPKGE